MSTVIYSSKMGNDSLTIELNSDIHISFFSIFDSSTNETDSINCKFSLNEFENAINELKKNGSCSLESEYYFIKIKISKNKGSDIELGTKMPMKREYIFNDENFYADAMKI